MGKIRGNEVCRSCVDAHNGLNGRFCRVKGCYVEHAVVPFCGKEAQR